MNRVELVELIRSFSAETDSNIKFLTIFRTRLLEENIPSEYASLIAGAVLYDFSNVPEDDDTLSDIATEYASYCKLVYDKLKLFGVANAKEFSTFSKLFARIKLEVEH